jgi:hypothetical protein
VTAVTTAGLLAGLFGSAFVPSAYGAGRTSGDTTVKAKYTEVTASAAGDIDAIGTSTSKFQVESGLSSAGGRTVDGNVAAGDNFVWNLFTAGAAGEGTTPLVVGPGDTLKATSSNSAVVVAWAYDNAGDDDSCADLDGVDETNTDAVFSASDSVTDVDPFGTEYAGDDAYKTDSDYVLCVAAKTATSAGTSTITVSYNGTTAGSITVTAVGPVASLTASIADGYKYIAEDNEVLDSWIQVVAKDAAGTIINGAANSASALGTALEDDEASLPENAQGDVIEAFLETGTALTDANPTSASLNRYSVAAGVCTGDSGSVDNPEGDGDAGKSYSFKVASGTVVSNAITITCTLNSDGARITKITPEATTGALDYDDGLGGDDLISVVATVVDAAGRPLGDGADVEVDFNDGDALVVDDGTKLTAVVSAVAFVGGEYEVFTIETNNGEDFDEATELTAAGRYAYSITLASIDLSVDAGDEIEKKYSFAYYAVDGDAYTATISRKMNKAKTQATITADMGPELGMTAITFTAELPSGATRTYKRKANADGIAVLRLNMRNRIVEVYAVDGDDAVITDPITVRFR